MNLKNDIFTFNKLDWDTNYFKVPCSKITLHKSLELSDWKKAIDKIKEFTFISIINKHSNPKNAQFLGEMTSAFVVDTNIQFSKKLKSLVPKPQNITIINNMEKNEILIEIADFPYSKFIDDPELEKRGGQKVYAEWVLNSFRNPQKFFALSRNHDNEVNGFLLYSLNKNVCLIELISVSKNETNSGIGRTLFQAVEHEMFLNNIKEIQVGTQSRNLAAINFYNKVGCKQIGCHQIYHLWNFKKNLDI